MLNYYSVVTMRKYLYAVMTQQKFWGPHRGTEYFVTESDTYTGPIKL